MSKLYLTSVFNVIKDINELQPNRSTKLIVFPLAHATEYLPTKEAVYYRYDRDIYNRDSIFWSICRPFIDKGIDPDNIYIVNHYTDPIALIKYKIMQPNTWIAFPGGRPELIKPIINKLDIKDYLLATDNPIICESAGSMYWSHKFFVWKDGDYDKYKSYKGLGVIRNYTFVPHFKAGEQSIHVARAARRFHRMNPLKTIYLMPDNGYIIYDTNTNDIIEKHNVLVY